MVAAILTDFSGTVYTIAYAIILVSPSKGSFGPSSGFGSIWRWIRVHVGYYVRVADIFALHGRVALALVRPLGG